MSLFTPNELFDLTNFSHRALFDNIEHVWEALDQLASYLDSISLGKIEGEVSDQATLVNFETISIGKGTVVEPGAYIKGPCVIGSNCQVRHGAYIRGNVVTGDHCVIGHATEVKNSIFLNRALAAHFAYVGDSILGNETNLGAGTILANLRFDRGEVTISLGDHMVVETGRKKLGAILADGAQTGCNSVLNPGTLFEKGAACLPVSRPKGVIHAKTKLAG